MRSSTPDGIEMPEDYDVLSVTSDIDASDNELASRGVGPDLGQSGADFQMPHLPSLDSSLATTSLTIDPPLSSDAYARVVPALEESLIAETCLRFPAAANSVSIGPVDFELIGAGADAAQLIYEQIGAKIPHSGRLSRTRLLWEGRQFMPGRGFSAITGDINKRRVRLCYHGLLGTNPKARGPDPVIPLAHDILDPESSQYRRITASYDSPLVEILHSETMELAAVPIPADSLTEIPLVALINVRGEPMPLREFDVDMSSEGPSIYGRRSWMLFLLGLLLAVGGLGYRNMNLLYEPTNTPTQIIQLDMETPAGALENVPVAPANEIVEGLRLVTSGLIGTSTAVMLGVERGIDFLLDRLEKTAHFTHQSVCSVLSQTLACHRGPGLKQCLLDHDELLVAREHLKDECKLIEDSLGQWAHLGRNHAISGAGWLRDQAGFGARSVQQHCVTWTQLVKESLLSFRRTSLDTMKRVYDSYTLNPPVEGFHLT